MYIIKKFDLFAMFNGSLVTSARHIFSSLCPHTWWIAWRWRWRWGWHSGRNDYKFLTLRFTP